MASPSALSSLKNARGKALEAVAEIEEMIRMNADAGVMDLRVDWAICELTAAITELRMAHQKAHEPSPRQEDIHSITVRDESGRKAA